MIYLFTILCVLAFIVSFRRDPRSLINAFLFLLSIGTVYLSLVALVYERLPKLHNLMLDILYKFIPTLIVVLAVLMIANGLVVLKKKKGKGYPILYLS